MRIDYLSCFGVYSQHLSHKTSTKYIFEWVDGFLYKIKYCVVLEGEKAWCYVREMSFDTGNEKIQDFCKATHAKKH